MEHLAVKPEGVYWDGTFGGGGHTRALLERLSAGGRVYASDWDAEAADRADALRGDPRFVFVRESLEGALAQVPRRLDGFIWDLGLSMFQIKTADRGFSFQVTGPLDMRMDHRMKTTAADLVNQMEEGKLADLIYRFGEERLSRRIARLIVTERRHRRIEDTAQLAEICRRAYPRKRHRIDPATRTFQALRVAVNDELGQLERCLPGAVTRLVPGGRGVVISFQSQEDRIVKHGFRSLAQGGGFTVVTKRPLVAGSEERDANPAARSAKFRVIEARRQA